MAEKRKILKEMASENQEERAWDWLKGSFEKIVTMVMGAAGEAKKLGQQDPRRIYHSFKVGLAISLVSLFYFLDFLYDGFGESAIWAVITVVLVLEFSVGATLGKGLNRGAATLLGGALGVLVDRLASFTGEKAEPFILGLFISLISALATFVRFFPKLKARCDYGIMIFILTFNLIFVSGYRDDKIIEMAHRRLSTIMIGGAISVLISIFICPIWAGADLHNLTATNIEKLGIFLEGFGCEYFGTPNDINQEKKATISMDGYGTVLNSKDTEENLANLAKWEPRHGKFKYWHPWDQYLKIGSNTRECAYRIDALNGHLNSEMKTPLEIRTKIQESCSKMSSECGHALRELAKGIKTMTRSSSADTHIETAKNLKSLLQTGGLWPEEADLLPVIPAAAVASLLMEIVSCTVKIADSVHELASLSEFKTCDNIAVMPNQTAFAPTTEGSRVSIVVE